MRRRFAIDRRITELAADLSQRKTRSILTATTPIIDRGR
jgi:hypothetical protein